MTLVKIAAAVASLYLLVVALVAIAQDWLLFPRWAMSPGRATLPVSAERLTVETDGAILAGVRLTGDQPPPDAALILGFGGNAWDADALALYLGSILPDRDVVTFHYRGYGPSTGRPSAATLLDDAVAVHDHLAATLRPGRIVAVGLSVGAGSATHLASRRPLAGLILVTPFDSLEALARAHYPWAPVRLLLRHRIEVAEALAQVSAPVALIAAGADTIVPPARTAPLRRVAADVVLDTIVEGAGHNDLYDRPAFAAALREALARIEARH